MHVEMENIIKKLERYIEDDEVTYEFDDAIEELEQLDLGLSSVESLLGFMEKHPFTDFGMPGVSETDKIESHGLCNREKAKCYLPAFFLLIC